MDQNKTLKTFLLGLGVGVLVVVSIVSGAAADRIVGFKFLDKIVNSNPKTTLGVSGPQMVVDQESVVTKVVEKAGPSVVTVSISTPKVTQNNIFDPFGDFFGNMFGQPMQPSQPQPQGQNSEQDIGSGFVISSDGLIVTNKHVVSDTTAKYKVITSNDEVLDVQNIYRDPVTDLAILNI